MLIELFTVPLFTKKLPVYLKPDLRFNETEFLKVVGVLMFKVTFDLLFFEMPPSAKTLNAVHMSAANRSVNFDNFIITDDLCYKYIKKYRVFVYHSYILFTLL